MANYRVEAIGPSSQAHGISDQEGSAYFVELEEALMQVVGIRFESTHGERTFLTTRPPTLDIFPSWPMRFQQTAKIRSCTSDFLGSEGNSQEEESSGSGPPALNANYYQDSDSPVSNTDSLDQSHERKKLEMLASNQVITQKKGIGCSSIGKNGKLRDSKTLRRLAQNREAARKSRLRKKAYIQQLESGRIKLVQLEQELQRVKLQGSFLGGDANLSGAATFDIEYGKWLEENYKHMSGLRVGLHGHLPDNDLRLIVDGCLTNYDDVFRIKASAAKADVIHLLSGMWKTPVERCFLWMGGFRPSDLIKMVMPMLDPLTEHQLMGVCNLQQSSQQAEDALSQGFEQLQRSLAETLAAGQLTTQPINVAEYMGQMAVALAQLANLEGFVRQADNLRQQTLHQLRRVLTIRQAARCFLAIGEYYSRLRALNSLWASRHPEGDLAVDDQSACAATASLQMLLQSVHSRFSAF